MGLGMGLRMSETRMSFTCKLHDSLLSVDHDIFASSSSAMIIGLLPPKGLSTKNLIS
jgi:hypothetical protein